MGRLCWIAWSGVSVIIFEERANAFMYLMRHYRRVVLIVDGVFATCRQMLVICIDTGTFLVKLWQNIGNVSGEAPWLLEKVVR